MCGKSISLTNTLPRHIFFGFPSFLLLILMFPSRVALGNENCSESLGAGKKAKFFAVIPKSAALQNRSYPCSLSVSLCNSPSLLISVSLAVYLCHLQTQTAGEWDFSRGEFSSVRFWGVASGVWASTVWPAPAPLPATPFSHSIHRVAMTTYRYSRVQTGCCQIPGIENTNKISNCSPEAQWVSVQLF